MVWGIPPRIQVQNFGSQNGYAWAGPKECKVMMSLGTLPWEGINVILAEPWLVLYRGLLQTSRTDVPHSLVLPGLSCELSL